MASDSPMRAPGAPRKRRRRLLIIVLPLVFLAVGWQIVERLIDIERYRGVIDKELELLIELPLTFGAMDLKLFPLPQLVVEDVTLGEENFRVTSPTVSVTADLGKLLRRRLELQTVTIHDARVELSPSASEFAERWGAYMLALETPDASSGKPLLKVTLAEIVANGIEVYRGETRYAEGDLRVSDVTDRVTRFTFNTRGTGMNRTPEIEGTFTLAVNDEPPLAGTARVKGMPLAELTRDHRLPPFDLDGDLAFALSQDDRLTWDATGTVAPAGATTPLGSYSMDGAYTDGALELSGLSIDTVPVFAHADLLLGSDGSWSLSVPEARLEGDGVRWLLAYLPMLPLRASESGTPSCTLADLQLGEDATNVFAVDAGTVETDAVDLVLDDLALRLDGLRSHVEISGDTYTIRQVSSDYVDVSGTLKEQPDGTVTLGLSGQAYLNPELPLPPDLYANAQFSEGTVDIRDFSTTLAEGVPVIADTRLDAAVHGGAVALWNRDRAAYVHVDGIGGAFQFENGSICLDRFMALGCEVSGELSPDPAFDAWRFATELRSDLTSPLWTPFYPDTKFTVANGSIHCPTVSGTYRKSTGELLELAVEGEVRDLEVGVTLDSYIDEIVMDTITLSARDNRLTYNAAGRSGAAGPIRAQGEYAPEDGVLDANVTFEPRTLLAGIVPPPSWHESARAMLQPLETMTVQTRYTSDANAVAVKAGPPLTLTGSIELDAAGGVEAATLVADLPADWLAPFVSPPLSLDGAAEAALKYAPATGALDTALILTNAGVRWRGLSKPPELPAVVEFSGIWAEGAYGRAAGQIRLGDALLPLNFDGARLSSDNIHIDLAHLAPLLPEGASLEGILSGSFSTFPHDWRIRLGGALWHPGDAVPQVGADGDITLDGGGWELAGMRLALDGQSAEFDLSHDGERLSGSVNAEAADIDTFLRDYEALESWWSEAMAPVDGEEPTPAAPLAGEVALSANTVTWGGATVNDASSTLTLADGAWTFDDLLFAHGTGTGSGTVQWIPAGDDATARIDVDMALKGVDLGLVESLLLEDARDMHGVLDAVVVLAIPIPPDDTPLHHGMRGNVEFAARGGSLGRAGLASKFLTALKTTDILRMRIPSLRDKGVTFKSLAGNVALDSGVFVLEPYHMEDTTYTLDARAELDFPKDDASGIVELTVLEGVTGIAGKIPLLGDAADMVNKAFGVELRITGSAADPTFLPGTPGPIKSLDSGLRNIFKGTQRLVGE